MKKVWIGKSIFLLALTMFLINCSSMKKDEPVAKPTPPSAPPASVQPADPGNPAAGQSTIYVVRTAVLGFGVPTPVTIDGQKAGTTWAMSYISAEVSPGDHQVCSQTENKSCANIKTEAGKSYYFEQEIMMGVVVAEVKLIQISDYDGKDAVSRCKNLNK
jgi:hypothetical protein